MAQAVLDDGSRFIVDLRAHTEWHGFYSGKYDDVWVGLCQRALAPGEAFLDVGANIGIYSVRVAAGAPADSIVLAFEPFPPNAERLRQNVALNGLDAKIRVLPFGLSDAAAELVLTLREDFQAGSMTGNAAISISPEADGNFERTAIHVKQLDEIRGELGNSAVGVIKVDIEGHEDQFLRGASSTLASDRPIIVAEACRHYYQSKGVSLAMAYTESLPSDYVFLRHSHDSLVAFTDFDMLGELENIVLCPIEKLDRIGCEA